MAHIQEALSKLWKPESTHDRIDSEKMFIKNIEQHEANYQNFLNHADTHNIKTYTALSQIGLTMGNETIDSIVAALPNNSKLQLLIGVSNNADIYPSGYGTLFVYKAGSNRISFEFYHSTDLKRWFGVHDGTKWSGWNGSTDYVPVRDCQLKFYNGLTDFGLQNDATLAHVWAGLPNGAILFTDVDSITDPSWNLPNKTGVIILAKIAAGRGFIHFESKDAVGGRYYMLLNGSNVPTGTWLGMGSGNGSANTVVEATVEE